MNGRIMKGGDKNRYCQSVLGIQHTPTVARTSSSLKAVLSPLDVITTAAKEKIGVIYRHFMRPVLSVQHPLATMHAE